MKANTELTDHNAVNVDTLRYRPFTNFDAKLDTEYNDNASRRLGKSYWLVVTPFRFYVKGGSVVNIPYGFLTDGATIPRPLWWLLPPWGVYGQAAVVHDYLCQYLAVMRSGEPETITRAQADSIFKQAMTVAGTPRWKRNVMYVCVRAFSKLFRGNSPVTSPLREQLSAEWVEAHPLPDQVN